MTQSEYLQACCLNIVSGSAHCGPARDQPVHVRAALRGQGGGKPRHRPPGVRARGRLQVSNVIRIRQIGRKGFSKSPRQVINVPRPGLVTTCLARCTACSRDLLRPAPSTPGVCCYDIKEGVILVMFGNWIFYESSTINIEYLGCYTSVMK